MTMSKKELRLERFRKMAMAGQHVRASEAGQENEYSPESEAIGGRRRIAVYAFAFLLYLTAALALFLPMIGNASRSVMGNSGDIYQNMWNLWWTKYALETHVGIYSTTKLLFWPAGYNLIYETLTPIQGLISIPFQSVSLPFAYNVLFFLGFALSGIFAFLLVDYMTKNKYAAFLGGFFFTFSAFHIAMEFSHTHMFFIGLMPLFAYLLLRGIDSDGRTRYIFSALAGISFTFIVFTDEFEEGIMAMLLALIVVLYYVASEKRRGKVLKRSFAYAILVFMAALFLSGFWGYMPLLHTLGSQAGIGTAMYGDTISNNVGWSSNLFSFFLPNYYFYKGGFHNSPNLFYGSNDRISYIGYTLLILAAYGAYRQSRKARLWMAVAIIFFILALGPYLKIGSMLTFVPLPYLAYHHIPYLNVIREPARFTILLTTALVVLGGFGVKDIVERLEKERGGRAKAYAFSAALCLLFIAESFGIPTPHSAAFTTTPYVPAALERIVGSAQGNFSILILPQSPIPDYIYDGIADYYTTALKRPVIGGYTTRENETVTDTITGLPFIVQATYLAVYNNTSYYTTHYTSPISENYTVQSIEMLKAYNTRFIVVENNAYTSNALIDLYTYMNETFGAQLYKGANVTIYSTENALQENLSGYFVSYYNQTDWTQLIYSNLNTYIKGWTPIAGSGEITVYAPKSNSTASTNAIMSFEGFASKQLRFMVSIAPYAAGQNSTAAYFVNVTPGLRTYSLGLALRPGPAGNRLFFFDRYLITGNVSDTVLMDNITFSYRNS